MTLKVLFEDQLHPYHHSRNAQLFPDDGPQYVLYEVNEATVI